MNLFDTIDGGDHGSGSSGGPAAAKGVIGRRLLPSQVAACLKAGGFVLTGNARAARALSVVYAEVQRRNGLEAWASPQIADWASFLNLLWNQLLLTEEQAPLLLSALQESAVWKRLAAEHGDAGLVVSLDGIAELAQSAYALLNGYEAHGRLRHSWASGGSQDAEAFRRWTLSFDELCSKRNWLSQSHLEAHVGKAIEGGGLDLPREVLLVGFDRVLPSQKRVLAALEEQGIKVRILDEAAQPAAVPTIIEAKDWREEIEICAWWARKKLLERPESRLGILVHGADAVRGEIERTFRRILLPASIGIESRKLGEPYEFSLGRALTAVPLVRAALLLLRWIYEPLPLNDVSWLLTSGFVLERSGDWLPLALLDAGLRQRTSMPPEISLEWWLRHTLRSVHKEQSDSPGATLRKRLLLMQQAATTSGVGNGAIRNSRRTYPQWLETALECLATAGWPGPEKEDSSQFQARGKFQRVMELVASLSFDGDRVRYREFLSALFRAAAETVFAPQSRSAPIQIMGPMEAAGQTFDATWFIGANDLHWPGKAAPHPLIPLRLQREFKMPHATSEADWKLAAQVTGRFAASAAECVVSYAKQVQRGDVEVSPVLASLFGSPLQIVSSLDFLAALGVAVSPPHLLQSVETTDTSSIPWPAEVTPGGTEILKMQAACPFQAFAKRRLGANAFDQSQRGLTPKDRGTLIHKILENIWSPHNEPQLRLQNRTDLISAQADGRIEGIIDHHVTEELRGHSDSRDPWITAYLGGERNRLCELIRQWLERETERAPFEVQACEVELPEVLVGELKLNLRIDRIDRVSSGGAVLLDYKSGKVSKSEMNGERPDEPQLPLYAVYGNVADLKGVFYAQVRPHETGFHGRFEGRNAFYQPGMATNRAEDFNEDIQLEWQKSLLTLAEEFIHGVNSVTPKKYPKTCEHCPLPSLCRVADTPVPVNASSVDESEDFAGGEARYE